MKKTNEICKKIATFIKKIYGYGIFACLFLGGLTVLGYIAALLIGGDLATKICEFIYKTMFYWLILSADVFVLLGLVAMYLSGEKSMTILRKAKKDK